MLHKCTSGPFPIVSYWRTMMSYNHQNGEVNLQKLTFFVMMKPSNCIQKLRLKQIYDPRSYSELLTRGATIGVCVSQTRYFVWYNLCYIWKMQNKKNLSTCFTFVFLIQLLNPRTPAHILSSHSFSFNVNSCPKICILSSYQSCRYTIFLNE